MNNNLTYSILQKNPKIKIQSAGCSCLLRMVVQQEFVCYYLDLVKRSQPSLPIFREVSATVATVLFFLSSPPARGAGGELPRATPPPNTNILFYPNGQKSGMRYERAKTRLCQTRRTTTISLTFNILHQFPRVLLDACFHTR
jgi:hypothetical protein